MSSIKSTPVSLMISDTGNDEIKIFECEKHEEDNADRLSPVIKDEEVRARFIRTKSFCCLF